MNTWEPVPLDDITVTELITHEGDPVASVLCPCGAEPLIDDAGPGWCPRCGRRYRIGEDGRIMRAMR
jgi:hypothetical protein